MTENLIVTGAESVSRFEIKRYGYTFTFEVSSDALECLCSYEPSTIGGTPLTKAELQEHLAKFKITEGIIPEAESTLLVAAVNGKSVSRLLLARGTAMIPGENGRIITADAKPPQEEGLEAEAGGTVDFRNVQSFLNVDAGDLIATIKHPGLGVPGRTVTGKTIPSQPGIPVRCELGENVRLGDDGVSIYALGPGRVCLRDDAISVEDIYEVPGNVDFKVGNINFKGFVEVKGDVLDGFIVKATKGIKIQGNVGVCTIESGGDVSFGGMSGQGTGTVTCGGSLSANFINDAVIECAGNIAVEIEVRSSQIKCLGSITVNKGGLTGGEYFALAGIECGNLGARTSLRTRVVAGVHYGDLEEINGVFSELKQLVAEFSAAPKETVDLKEFTRKRALITERTQEIRGRSYEQCNPKINVKSTLYEGVSITLGMVSDTVRDDRTGPISIIENSIEGGFRFLGMTPLSFKAREMEQVFVQQQESERQKKWTNIQEDGA